MAPVHMLPVPSPIVSQGRHHHLARLWLSLHAPCHALTRQQLGSSLTNKSDHITALLTMHHWQPINLRIKSPLLTLTLCEGPGPPLSRSAPDALASSWGTSSCSLPRGRACCSLCLELFSTQTSGSWERPLRCSVCAGGGPPVILYQLPRSIHCRALRLSDVVLCLFVCFLSSPTPGK